MQIEKDTLSDLESRRAGSTSTKKWKGEPTHAENAMLLWEGYGRTDPFDLHFILSDKEVALSSRSSKVDLETSSPLHHLVIF